MGCRCNPHQFYGDVTLPALYKRPYLASSHLLTCRQWTDKMSTKNIVLVPRNWARWFEYCYLPRKWTFSWHKHVIICIFCVCLRELKANKHLETAFVPKLHSLKQPISLSMLNINILSGPMHTSYDLVYPGRYYVIRALKATSVSKVIFNLTLKAFLKSSFPHHPTQWLKIFQSIHETIARYVCKHIYTIFYLQHHPLTNIFWYLPIKVGTLLNSDNNYRILMLGASQRARHK
jgi:hypothetical protein